MAHPEALAPADVALAQALADVASIAVVQDQVTRQSAIREGQLQNALTSRIAIEQAKGMIAERAGVSMDQAFAKLRGHARSTNQRLTEVATGLVAGAVSMDAIIREQPVPMRVAQPRDH
jgi:AmiR/NasT family two-component response regulator